jgi:hypothetical protein
MLVVRLYLDLTEILCRNLGLEAKEAHICLLVTLKVSLKKFFQPVARKPYFIDDDAQFI